MFKESTFSLRVRISREKIYYGPGIHQIFKLVNESGSLHEAAERSGISYSKAWNRVRTAEKELGFPLLHRRIGGTGGGSSQLTPGCLELMHRYEGFIKDLSARADHLFALHFKE